MKIRELFKKIEVANEVMNLTPNDCEGTFCLWYEDGLNTEQFKDYKSFLKFVKDNFNEPWAKMLKQNIEIEQKKHHDNVFIIRLHIEDVVWQVNEWFTAELTACFR